MAKIDRSGRKEAMERLTKEFRKLEFSVIGIVAMLILGIAAASLSRFWLAEAIMVATALFFFFYFKRKQNAYKNACVAENLRSAVMPLLGASETGEKYAGGLTIQTVRDARLVPVNEGDKSVSFFWGLQGQYRHAPVSTADIAIVESITNGGRGTMINCGNWTHFRLKQDTGLDLRILDRRVLPDDLAGPYLTEQLKMQAFDPAALGLDERFVCATADPAGTVPVLSEAFLTELKALADYTPGALAISIRGQEADVYLRNRFLAGKFSSTVKVREEMLDFDPLPELEKICSLITRLNS